jgi:hypothetical protein
MELYRKSLKVSLSINSCLNSTLIISNRLGRANFVRFTSMKIYSLFLCIRLDKALNRIKIDRNLIHFI